jgi:putative zinc finger/helix-turn-helix YgiT family protein
MTYCETCHRSQPYRIERKTETITLKVTVCEFMADRPTCTVCGNEVYVGEIEDRNQKALYDAYRVKNDIISLERIQGIPEKYDIGKRPLSRALGLGELTYTRYLEGAIPNRANSDLLKRADEDPEFYLSLLESNREKLDSDAAFQKSMRAVHALIATANSDGKELFGSGIVTKVGIARVADYLVKRTGDMSNMALQKALYYVQGFSYAFQDKPMFSEDCEAWIYGPVYRSVYNQFRLYGYDSIPSEGEPDVTGFSELERSIMDSVSQHFGCYTGNVLLRFTHNELPWMTSRNGLGVEEKSEAVIPKETIRAYFLSVKESFRMLNPGDISAYARHQFEQYSGLRC